MSAVATSPPDHAARSHRRFAASAAERWFLCPGSIRMCDGAPERRSPYAEEGTQAHELLERRLRLEKIDIAKEEMWDATQVVFDHVMRYAFSGTTPTDVVVEEQFLVPSKVAPGQVGGTVDVLVYQAVEKTLHVIDFKYGSGVPVEVKGNKQLRTYGVAAINSDFGWKIEKVILTIIQPRAFHPDGPIRSEELSVADLIDFHADIEQAVSRCLVQEAELAPGEAQCRWCPAASFCPAREEQALAVVGDSFGHIREVTKEKLPDVKSLTPAHMGEVLAAMDLVSDWFETVQEEAFRLAMDGVAIPGHKLVQPIGRRQWVSEPAGATAHHLALITGSDPSDWLEDKLIGITEAEKRLKPFGKKGADLMKSLTVKSSTGKLQLVSENDKRPAVDPASQAFKDVVQIGGVA